MEMATNGEDAESSSKESLQLSFPLPPAVYYKNYTDSDTSNGLAPKPPPVITGSYSMFGDSFDTNEDIIRSLECQGIPRLYSAEENCDILAEMKKINHSILVNFLELMDVVIDVPLQEEKQRKLDDINILFINLHHLINEFRPHQARETLRVMLYKQKSQRLETAEKLMKHIEKTRTVLKSCYSNLINRNSSSKKSNQTENIEMKDDMKCELRNDENDNMETEILSNEKLMCDIIDDIT